MVARRCRAWLAGAMLALLIASGPAAASAAFTVGSPSYREGDWFEFDGWTASVFAHWEAEMANGSAEFSEMSIDASVPMRLDYGEDETIALGGEDIRCRTSLMSHAVNMTVRYTPGSTTYDGDEMRLNVTTTIAVWTPEDVSRHEKRIETVRVETWFSGGGADNLLEIETIRTETLSRDGAWPARFSVGDVWDFVEDVDLNTTTRTRENGGLWNETGSDSNISRTITWSAEAEESVLTGVHRDEEVQALRVQGAVVGSNASVTHWYAAAGYLVKTQQHADGAILLSATLADHAYDAAEEKHTVVSSNLPAITLLATAALLPVAAIAQRRRSHIHH